MILSTTQKGQEKAVAKHRKALACDSSVHKVIRRVLAAASGVGVLESDLFPLQTRKTKMAAEQTKK